MEKSGELTTRERVVAISQSTWITGTSWQRHSAGKALL